MSAFTEAVRQRVVPYFTDLVRRFTEHVPTGVRNYSSGPDALVNQKIFEISAVVRNLNSSIQREIQKAGDMFIAKVQEQTQTESSNDKPVFASLEDIKLVDLDEMDAHIVAEMGAREISAKIDKVLSDAFNRLKPYLDNISSASDLVFHPLFLIQLMLDMFRPCRFSGEQHKVLIKLFQGFMDPKALEKVILEVLEVARIPEARLEVVVSSGLPGRGATQSLPALNNAPGNAGGYPDPQAYAGGMPHGGGYGGPAGGYGHAGYGAPPGPAGSAYPDGGAGQHPNATQPVQGVGNLLNFLMNGQGYQTTLPASAFATGNLLSGAAMPPGESVFPGIPEGAMEANPQGMRRSGPAPSIFSGISHSVATSPIQTPRVSQEAITTVIETTQLINLLSHVQATQLQQLQSFEHDVESPVRIRQKIASRLKNSEGEYETLLKKDLDIIDLVSTIFEFILDDENIPLPMKAMLGRLQIPFLKIALMDPELFRQESHPARLLLNLLSRAGMGWQKGEASSDALFSKIEHVVFRLLEEFENNPRIFEELLEEFSHFFTKHQQRLQTLAQRTQKTEEQRAQAVIIRAEIQKVFHTSMAGKELPLPVIRTIHEGWRHVMFLEGVRDGIKSRSWQNNLATLNKLITLSTLPRSQFATPGEYLSVLDKGFQSLSATLHTAMEAAGIDAVLVDELIQALMDMASQLRHTQTIPTLNVVDQAQVASRDQESLAAISENAGRQVFEAGQTVMVDAPQDLSDRTLPEDDPHMRMVRQLEIGNWIEVSREEGTRERQKLIARVRTIDRQIFANSRGLKVAEYSTAELAKLLKTGHARVILEQQPLVDRALESLAISLKQSLPAGQ